MKKNKQFKFYRGGMSAGRSFNQYLQLSRAIVDRRETVFLAKDKYYLIPEEHFDEVVIKIGKLKEAQNEEAGR
jgi:translation elongation factor P/translation initiation factor 5A